MKEVDFLGTLHDLKERAPEEYRVKVSSHFRDFIRQQIEDKLSIDLKPEKYATGIVFRHRSDLLYKSEADLMLYLESKVIARPERVRLDYHKRMYQVALASVDLKLKHCTVRWRKCKEDVPYVAFTFAIPVETPLNAKRRVEEKMVLLLKHYVNACCLYIFDFDKLKRRDDLLTKDELTLDAFLDRLGALLGNSITTPSLV